MTAEVSVIVVTHNRRAMVREAVASVLSQRDARFELIVVDDGSTDGTGDDLEALAAKQRNAARRPSIQIVRAAQNCGVAAARNAGVARATAPLVAFLDSDDWWAPTKLRRQLDFMVSHPECVIAQTEEIWIRKGVRVNPGLRHRKRAGDIFIASTRTCLLSPSAVIIRLAQLRKIGGFDEDFAAAEDYDLWMRMLAHHEAGLIDEPLVTRRAGHPGQLSATVPAMDRFRILALLKLLAGHNLSANRRAAVCDVLAEKCRIVVHGLARRGHQAAAERLSALAERSENWIDGAEPELNQLTASLRPLLTGKTMSWDEAPPVAAAG
jgi:glycosyltransferase involved in cell wall biosynthesis